MKRNLGPTPSQISIGPITNVANKVERLQVLILLNGVF